ncbi:cysteine proteinase [Phellopilus nigrolimitatus]|nr:cysteine proteinase [Phellopilus nigrolimitatus]
MRLADDVDPPIDGREEQEEKRWWDLHSVLSRPGPGMLPPFLADELHTADHSLVSVSVALPDLQALASPSSSPAPGSSPPGKQPGHSRPSSISANSPPPLSEEVHEAIPHPHAYYCRKHHGWVLLAWRSSSILPPLAESFLNSEHLPFPNQDRRKKTHNCLEETPFGKPNKTHHFHKYAKAVDARHMSPKYEPRTWEKAERSKRSRRRMTIGSDDLDPEVVARAVQGDFQSEMKRQLVTNAKEEEEARDLLDLYVCCQCSFYVVVSDVIPGVIPCKYVDEFQYEKSENPPLGKTGQQSVHAAWETVITVIENKLWKGNNRLLSVHGRSFSLKVGWNPAVEALFGSIGFKLIRSPLPESSERQEMLQPPNTDPSTEIGRMNRQRLLRAWVEVGIIIAQFRRQYSSVLKDYNPHKLWIKTESAREMYQTAMGAHADQIKRGQLPEALHEAENLKDDWSKLGTTPSTYDSELLHFAYLAQCRCDPRNTPEYFQSLVNIVDALRTVVSCPAALETLVGAERSRGRFTTADVHASIRELGFGVDNELRVDYDNDVDDAFIRSAWRDAVRRSWTDADGASKRRDVNEAFRVIAESRRSVDLVRAWDDEETYGMTPDRAYSTLEVPMGVDEDMLITVYNMRVEDQPSSLEKMRDAMRVIAEFTRNERLQRFLDTGSDPGIIVAATRADWPRGLNQLGNTCYLNSLLQYFYTIKDIRDAIAPLAITDEKFADNDKLKDDDLKNHRVGGRIVSRSEVVRSRKFVSQLANLFWHMENSEVPAVTPTLELAKLALVTSKDEEEEDPERGGTDSSHSTDATLVDEPAPTAVLRESSSPQPKSPSPGSPGASPGASSVLGKRPRGFSRKKSDSVTAEGGVVDEQEKDSYVLVSKPSGSNTPVAENDADTDGDVGMAETGPVGTVSSPQTGSKAPPLPPRQKTQSSGSDMMFGKQHDVAECMDNCMFQIETALLRFGELAGPDDSSKRSIVKKLFYGKIRQRLSLPPDPNRTKSSLHEREDYFSHLPVNVSEESFDLYDGLSSYFDDVVEYDGTKAKMEVSLVELPPIMQIQLQRVQFNRDTLQPFKSHAYVKFGESISMDRFLDDAPAEKKARSRKIQAELSACRERIYHLTQGKFAPYDQSLTDTHAFLSRQSVLDLPEAEETLKLLLLTERENVEREIGANRARIAELKAQLEEEWRGEHRAEYELTSVFVHRGSTPSFGHYFIYQRWLPDHKDEWFKYNDSDVGVVSKEEVLADTTGNTANPYLLVFARKGSQVIQTVQRADPMDVE